MVMAAWLLDIRLPIPVLVNMQDMPFVTAVNLFLCGLSAIASLSNGARHLRLSGYFVLLPLFLSGVRRVLSGCFRVLGPRDSTPARARERIL